MKAIRMKKFGGPEVLEAIEVPDPIVEPGQVMVEVEFANITFVDTQSRAGVFDPFDTKLPTIPGNGVGGVAASVGENVDEAWIGKRAIAITGGSGGYAERVALDTESLVEVPDGLGLDAATALLADGRTAKMLIRAASPREGDRVLVEAAAGSLGSMVVQLAKNAGATVVAAVGGSRKVDFVRENLDVDLIVDYSEPGWTNRIRESLGGVDVVFDGVGGDIGKAAFELVERGGRMAIFGLSSGSWSDIPDDEAAERGIEKVGLWRPTPEEAREATESALSDAAVGKLRPIIGQTFPLERAAEAHAAIEARATIGKTLLTIRPSSPFTESELEYLRSQPLGRLATVQPDGTLQNSPVGFRYNPETATIDIGGYDMSKSRKYKNIADNGRAAFVVDDVLSTNPWRVRCLEIRGRAEGVETSEEPFIRVYPERIISFGIDEPDKDPHELEGNFRNADEPPERGARN